MVTDKQINKNKTKQKGKNKREGYWRSKTPQQFYVGLGPKQGRCLQKILFREQTASSMTANFSRAKLRQVWLRISERKTASSMTANFPQANCVKRLRIFQEQTASSMTTNFLATPFLESLLAPSSWDRVDDPQLAEVVLKPTYCWSCYVADVRERAADQMTKIKQ